MNTVGHMTDRDLVLRPAGKQGLENFPADLSVEATHAIDKAAAPQSQIGHVKGFRIVVGILPTQG